jgi:hypothetical protein
MATLNSLLILTWRSESFTKSLERRDKRGSMVFFSTARVLFSSISFSFISRSACQDFVWHQQPCLMMLGYVETTTVQVRVGFQKTLSFFSNISFELRVQGKDLGCTRHELVQKYSNTDLSVSLFESIQQLIKTSACVCFELSRAAAFAEGKKQYQEEEVKTAIISTVQQITMPHMLFSSLQESQQQA